ncbi:MAG: SpoIIE family protein phosphatase [Xanthomonadales bacterium]|nr:hypothetical protein [Xanthomonadales bacterium]MCC6591918.1 SpoIIE family protein phosphatase [Xanthomonadales bacterium]MCE7930060.1 response regulator [Xanthomonadales bacterium PRO6]
MSIDDDDEALLLLEDDQTGTDPGWKILIVDDEPAIHEVTTLVLGGVRFQERRLAFLHAYNGEEARRVLAENPDIAVVLLDVVMESDDAGLRLVRHIREEARNERVRIILRTGQAGQAPERQVVLNYDINDYKEKTELTAQKLSTAVIAALRGYKALLQLADLNRELEAKVAQRTEELRRANARLQQSLAALELGERAGRRVQFKLLPPAQWRHGDIRYSHALMPSEFMSGDFVDYFAIDAHRAGCYVADVSGHGVASAFVTVYLKRFMAGALEAYRLGQPSHIVDPAMLLAQLNQDLLRERLGKHIAIWYGVFDHDANRLSCANAGAIPYPLLADAEGTRFLDAKSSPAGLFDSSSYRNQLLSLAPQFRLLLCSDGVLELMPEAGADARNERLREWLHPASPGLPALLADLRIRADEAHPDDLALLLVGRDVVEARPSSG